MAAARESLYGWAAAVGFAYATVLPVLIAGCLAGLVARRARPAVSRPLIALGMVVAAWGLLALVLSLPIAFNDSFDPSNGLALSVDLLTSPELLTFGILFFWIPLAAQFVYMLRSKEPTWLAAGMTGVAAVLLGVVALAVIGTAIGAQSN